MQRRRFLQTTALLSATASSTIRPRPTLAADAPLTPPPASDAPRTISQHPQYYHGWPTVTRCANGDLWLAWSGGREEHVCPFGQVWAMVSHDEGETWTWPRVLLDSSIDDRDCGIIETAKGTLLLSTFTSLAYQPSLEKNQAAWPAEKLARWNAVHQRLSPTDREAQLGHSILRSTDAGKTWSSPSPTPVNSPHGPIQLRDGRLLYAGKQLWAKDKAIAVATSSDDGLTWENLTTLPTRPGDQATNGYHELHAVEAADGALIVQIRNHNQPNENETLQTESHDGGRTWTTPHPVGVWGLPSHLLRLRDDRLLMTYGHRRKPFGNQARLSTDHGKTWGEPIPVSTDGSNGDLGYPSTVELRDGSLLSVWYEKLASQPKAVLRQARWKLP